MTERSSDPHYHTNRILEMVNSRRHVDVVIRLPQNKNDSFAIIEMKTQDPAPVLAFAAPQSTISIKQMQNNGRYRTAPIIPLESDNPTREDIAKTLPGFIHDHYPQADGYPIRIFEENDSTEPLLEVIITNNLVTIHNQASI